MELADRLRETADGLPAAPPGDPVGTFRRGRRRRQRRRAAGAMVASAGVLAIVAIGLPLLPSDGPDLFEVADQPPGATEPGPGGDQPPIQPLEGWATIIGPPAVMVSSAEPFAWAVAVSPGEDERWCATTTRGSTALGDATGQPCDELIDPDEEDPRAFGTAGSEVTANPDGTPAEGLWWGFAPAPADEVMVLFTDGTRVIAELADEVTGDGRLWAIGHLGAEFVALEARAAGEVLGGRIPAPAVPATGPTTSPQEAFGDRLERAQLEQFSDDAPAVFDLRTDDELYSLGLPNSWRAVGIRIRDGHAPLMWATDCDLLTSEPLPEGWIGLCREYTDPQAGRVSGLFWHGTTSVTADPRDLDADPELTERFIEAFTACLTDQGISVDRVDAVVTEDRELQLLGWAGSGDEPPGADSTDLDCETALLQELRLRPHVD